LRILLDDNYAHSRHGTGISTYARSLARGLSSLGHQVEWLAGAAGGDGADRLVEAAALYDAPAPARGPRQWAQTAAHMAGGLMRPSVSARQVKSPDVVVAPSPEEAGRRIHLAPDIFVHAHYRHMLLREFTDVRLSSAVDVLHLTAPLPVAMKGVRRVVTIHDLVPVRLPYTTPDDKAEFIARVRRCAREADLIITVSQASQADIVSLLDIDPHKVAVTYQPSDMTELSPAESDRLPRSLSRFGLAPDGYLLCVGAQEPKKNMKRLIEAFLDADTGLPLVICGPRGWMWEREVGAALEPLSEAARARIRFTGYVDREDLRRLYAGACALVFPSLYEGFGLPALEAMIAGCPVVASETSSLPEICGEAALYINPLDRDDIRQAIETITADPALRKTLAAAGRIQAQAFAFEPYRERLAAAYGRLGS
jgi:glycosyltransferase involved in cell wall biosynthesis